MERLLKFLSEPRHRLKPENLDNLKKRLSTLDSNTLGAVVENIFLMFSKESGGIMRAGESMGGNLWNGLSCSTHNFYLNSGLEDIEYDGKTFEPGRILYFEIPQYTPKEIREICSEGHFMLGYDSANQRSVVVEVNLKGLENDATQIIKETGACYNIMHGFLEEIKVSKIEHLYLTVNEKN